MTTERESRAEERRGGAGVSLNQILKSNLNNNNNNKKEKKEIIIIEKEEEEEEEEEDLLIPSFLPSGPLRTLLLRVFVVQPQPQQPLNK